MSEKQHPPSTKNLKDARYQGNLPRAPMLSAGAALFFGALALFWRLPKIATLIQKSLAIKIEQWPELAQMLFYECLLIIGLSALGAWLVGSLAGGVLFSPGALFRYKGSLSNLAPASLRWVSAVLSLVLFGVLLWGALRLVFFLEWAPVGSGVLLHVFWGVLYILCAVLALGIVQSLVSWLLWRRALRRSTQELRYDIKDEEGQAKQFFSRMLSKQKPSDG